MIFIYAESKGHSQNVSKTFKGHSCIFSKQILLHLINLISEDIFIKNDCDGRINDALPANGTADA
jgi:hypothetical protein